MNGEKLQPLAPYTSYTLQTMEEYHQQIDGRWNDFWDLDPHRILFYLFVALSAAVLVAGGMIAADPVKYVGPLLPLVQYGGVCIILYACVPTIIIWWPGCYCRRYAVKPVCTHSPIAEV